MVPLSTVMEAVAAPLMAFLQLLPSAVSVPVPLMVSVAPLFTFRAAPSKASATAASVDSSLAGSSLSVMVLVPSRIILTSVVLLQEIGAVVEEANVRSFTTNVTPVVSFLTLMLPSLQDPVTT